MSFFSVLRVFWGFLYVHFGRFFFTEKYVSTSSLHLKSLPLITVEEYSNVTTKR